MFEIHVTTIQLHRLEPRYGTEIVRLVAGGNIDGDLVARVVARTDGVPLFIEELTKALIEGGAEIAEAEIPAALQALLLARLDRLGSEAKETVQTGAVIGREFQFALLADAMSGGGAALASSLKQLIEAEILVCQGTPPQSRYVFRHALVQDAAYHSLLRRKRRQLHRQIAGRLEERHAEIVEAQPELIAHHYDAAGVPRSAIDYWLKAAERAIRQSANLEAKAHLRRGLDCIASLPDSRARAASELSLLIALGPVLAAREGWSAPATKATYQRASELCEQVDDAEQSFTAFWGTWLYRSAAGDTKNAPVLIDNMLDLARRENNSEWLMQAHHAGWGTTIWTGDLARALDHLEQGLPLYDSKAHRGHAARFGGHDPGVCGKVQGALALWLSGSPEQARASSEEGTALARRLDHPPSLAHALMFSAMMFQMLRDQEQLASCLGELHAVASEHGLAFNLVSGDLLAGWLRAQTLDPAAEIAAFSDALERVRSTGVRLIVAYQQKNLGQIYAAAGRFSDARQTYAEALTTANEVRELVWAPEIQHLIGELALVSGAAPGQAEAVFRTAVETARSQGSRSFELRAATSLARLLQQSNRSSESRALLEPIFGSFTEGFDTLDLKDARALLDDLC